MARPRGSGVCVAWCQTGDMAGNGRGWTGLGRVADVLGILFGVLAFLGVSMVTFGNRGDDEQPPVSVPTVTETHRVEPTTTSDAARDL